MMNPRQWIVYGLIDPRAPRAIRYVGITKNIGRRERNHRWKPARGDMNPGLAKWKEGLRKVEVQLLAIPLETHLDLASAQEAEKYFIADLHHRGTCGLLNIHSGGAWCPTVHTSPEHIERVRQAHLGKKMPAEAIAKTAAALRGRPKSPEARARMAAAGRVKVFSPEHRKHIGESGLGRHPTPETRIRLSEAQRLQHQRNPMSAETKAKIGEGNRGKKRTPEHREKMAAGLRAWREAKAGEL